MKLKNYKIMEINRILNKDEKYLLEHENYTFIVCPLCEQGNVILKTNTVVTCSFCGRQIEYKF